MELPSLEPKDIVAMDAGELHSASRRRLAKQILSLGGVALLTGCSGPGQSAVERMLRKVSTFNDAVQASLFDPHRLAPTYPASMITRPFPFNAYYDIDAAPEVDAATYRLELAGRVTGQRTWTLDQLRLLPQTEQITRLICVDGWSAVGRWGGIPLYAFLQWVGADTTAKYVSFQCADDYSTSIDMPSALHPQTMLALTYDGKVLPPKYGFPLRLRMPTKLGYKNAKHIVSIVVTNTYPGGYWENQGYNWFAGS